MPSMNPPNADSTQPQLATTESWFDDACVLDLDHFVKNLSCIRAKGVRPDLVGSLISHYASKWLPELSGCDPGNVSGRMLASPGGSVGAWMKKRFFIETLVGVLPPEKDSLQCGFLLRLLRAASMVEAGPACMAELEARVACQLAKATLKELLIPAFRHTSGTLLDVGLMLRLVRKFVGSEEGLKSGASVAKVAKLVDGYLAEAAVDAGLTVGEFEELACALPSHARAVDDGLYRAIDTFIKTHPSTTKEEKKTLCKFIDARKLSSEACDHAVHGDRLPVRSVIRILFSEHSKFSCFPTEWSGFLSLPRSPNMGLEPNTRSSSKRELLNQHQEMRRLKDDVARLKMQCQALQAQIDRIQDKNKKKKSLLRRWSSYLSRNHDEGGKYQDSDVKAGYSTPMVTKKAKQEQGRVTPKWRHSSS